jgi:hypothetical protein
MIADRDCTAYTPVDSTSVASRAEETDLRDPRVMMMQTAEVRDRDDLAGTIFNRSGQ